jgi:hypothetical protein
VVIAGRLVDSKPGSGKVLISGLNTMKMLKKAMVLLRLIIAWLYTGTGMVKSGSVGGKFFEQWVGTQRGRGEDVLFNENVA